VKIYRKNINMVGRLGAPLGVASPRGANMFPGAPITNNVWGGGRGRGSNILTGIRGDALTPSAPISLIYTYVMVMHLRTRGVLAK
jgi:hypothetical protein